MQKSKPFAEGASWAEDRELERRKSVRRAWTIVWILAGIAVAEAFALIALTPLKTVVPHTILVDRQTGFVTAVDPSRPLVISADEALERSLLVQYVVAREGFSAGSVRSDYRKVLTWSAGPVRDAYAKAMAATNPDSPLARLPRSSSLEVRPRSVSELGEGSALVRFDIIHMDSDGRASTPQPYAAVVDYRFAPRQMSVDERFINPLGFEVIRYRKDPEALPPAAPAAAVRSPELVTAADREVGR